MKIAVLIPDRSDRPEFLKNCLRMLSAQTRQADLIVIMDYLPESDRCDITQRYRRGYELISKMPVDVIAFIENDDWYSPKYLETMEIEWEKAGRPDLFGTDYTYYFHLGLRKYFKFDHAERASAMNTLIKNGLTFNWCVDNEPYTDIHLWEMLSKQKKILTAGTFHPDKPISMGIKHGTGKSGGEMHTTMLNMYTNKDSGFLQSILDSTSFDFYNTWVPPAEIMERISIYK